MLLRLHRNMRVEGCGRDDDHVLELRRHADWLLQLGDDKLPHVQPAGEIELQKSWSTSCSLTCRYTTLMSRGYRREQFFVHVMKWLT